VNGEVLSVSELALDHHLVVFLDPLVLVALHLYRLLSRVVKVDAREV